MGKSSGIYNDYRYFVNPDDFKIADYRLSTDLSRRIIDQYNAMLMNVNTHKQEKNIGFVKQSFAKAVGAFMKATANSTIDPQAFLGFINTDSSKSASANHAVALQAKNSLTQLSKIFDNFILLGLNKRELGYAKTSLANKVKPKNVTTQQMIDLIEASKIMKSAKSKSSRTQG